MNNTEEVTQKGRSLAGTIRNSFKELKDTSIAFLHAPAALWGINIPYVLEGLVYFGVLTILGKFASENVGLTDPQSGLVYSLLTGGITFAMLILGGYSDKIGVRKSLAVSLSVMVIGRLLLALSDTLKLQNGLWSPTFFTMMAGIIFIFLSYGLYQPAAYAGVRRYTTPQTAAMGYAVIYGLMNLGSFLSGFVSSFTRQEFENIFPPNGLAAVFWVYVIINIIAVIITLILLNRKNDQNAVKSVKALQGMETTAEDMKEESDKSKEKADNTLLILLLLLGVSFFLLSDLGIENIFNFFIEIGFVRIDFFLTLAVLMLIPVAYEFLRKRPFHPFRDKRFSFFIFILIPVQTLFAHNWLTIPLYLDRAFAGTFVGEYFEIFANINPILIFILAPFIAGLTANASVYKMMIIGTTVMALPTFLLAAGPNPYLFLLFILITTTGEAMWQPRFLQWVAEVAPKGMTGLYMGVGQFPWFLTKVITGFYSGYFLAAYVPADTPPSEMNSQMLWLIYAFIAIASPVGLILARKWVLQGFKQKSDE